MSHLPPLVTMTLAGLLGAITNVALGSRVIVLPRVEGHRIQLGFLAQLFLCLGVAHAMDHDFQTAFFSSLCSAAVLRQVKSKIDRVFGEEVRRFDGPAE